MKEELQSFAPKTLQNDPNESQNRKIDFFFVNFVKRLNRFEGYNAKKEQRLQLMSRWFLSFANSLKLTGKIQKDLNLQLLIFLVIVCGKSFVP